jgi:antitoxin PrlF
MPIAKVTSKNQVTLPKEIRDRLKIVPGNRIDFIVKPSGEITVKALNLDFRSLRGILKSKRKRPPTIEEMNEAIAAGWAGE